jgi:hypothetical protein
LGAGNGGTYMKTKNIFDLSNALHKLLIEKEELGESEMDSLIEEIVRETGLTLNEFNNCILSSSGHTLGNLKYRILAIMDKNKIDSLHII